MSGVWVYIEHANGDIAAISRELLGKGRALADTLAQPLGALVIGSGSAALAQRAFDLGAETAYIVDNAALAQVTTDAYVTAAAALVREHQPELVLTGSSLQMRDFAGALAAELGVGLVVDALDINIEDEQIQATRASHSGNVINTLTFGTERPAIIAARRSSFAEAPRVGARSGNVVTSTLPDVDNRTTVQQVAPNHSTVDLADATVVVAGGRGLGSAAAYQKLIPPLAEALGGAYGATGAIVEAGWVSHEHQIGQTSKTVSPQLYIACGISGAAQHLAGMRNSRTIVVINKDGAAPLMRAATYAVVGDVNEIVPLLTDEIKRRTEQ